MTVGLVSEPGKDTNEFMFLTPDDEKLKTGEFVYYNALVKVESKSGGLKTEEKKIYSRITDREECRGYPDEFMADPEVDPKKIAKKLGLSSEDMERYRITAKIIGFYDDRINDFTNPRIVPKPGTPIELAPDDDLERFLTNVEKDVASANIGDLLHRPPDQVNVKIPVDNFTATHLSILASTGSGKSYTCAVIAEELMKPDSRAALLILDPHGEYHTLKDIETLDEFQGEDGYSPEVQILKPDKVKIRISELSFSDLLSSLDSPTSAQEPILREAWNRLSGEKYVTPEMLFQTCYEIGVTTGNEASAEALEWRIKKAFNRELFDPSQNLALDDLLNPGQCSIIQLDTVSRRDQQMLVNVLFRKIYRERVNHEKGRKSKLDFPVFAILEEGHRFAPSGGDARSLPILRTILSEGRKFGFGIGVISQRPSKIDDDVLSQCKTQMIMQIQNPNDQDAIRRAVERVGEDLLDEVAGLTSGQAVVAGDSVNTPFLCRIRNRITDHGAESLKTSKRWRNSWKQNSTGAKKVVDADDEEGAEDREKFL